MIEVITTIAHQYRQKGRVVGEKYEADDIHVSLLKTLKWAKPVQVNAEEKPGESISAKTKDSRRALRTK